MRRVKRIANNAISMFGVLAIFVGLVICMCEVPELNKQLMTLCIGTGMIVLGVVMGLLANGVGNVHTR